MESLKMSSWMNMETKNTEMKNIALNHKDNIIMEITQLMPPCLRAQVDLMNMMEKTFQMKVASLDNTLFSNKLLKQELKRRIRKVLVASVGLLVPSHLDLLVEVLQGLRRRSRKLLVGLLMELQELVGHFLELQVMLEEETLLQVDWVV